MLTLGFDPREDPGPSGPPGGICEHKTQWDNTSKFKNKKKNVSNVIIRFFL